MSSPLISVTELQQNLADTVVVDCRFSLADSEAGLAQHREGHIAGAHYLHLDRDLSGDKGKHGGRHPLPDPQVFCDYLAGLGIATDTPVVAYDDARLAFASRLWWMMKALGYKSVRVLNGGFSAWQAGTGAVDDEAPTALPVTAHRADEFRGQVDVEGLRIAQRGGAILVDSREPKRYQGLEEPIDPVAGHIPGAVNLPWQEVTDATTGATLAADIQLKRWGELDAHRQLVVYCGSGVTACVNLLSLELAGRDNVRLYAGSWSDWCSYLETAEA